MKIESAEDMYREHADLKSTIKIAKKMFRESYKEEISRIKEFDKFLKKGIKSNEPVTVGTAVLSLITMDREIQRLHTNQYMQYGFILNVMEKSLESIIAINTIIPILKDITKNNKTKASQRRLEEIENTTKGLVDFRDFIMKSVKDQKNELKKQESKKSEMPPFYG